MTALLCIRHGQSTMNAEGRWQGQADPPLSRAGVAQALELAARLQSDLHRLGAVGGPSVAGEERTAEQWLAQVALFASDLQRAAETARLLGEGLGVVPTLHSGLREMDVGAWSGLRHAEIEARWPEQIAAFRAGDQDVRPGGGESRRDLSARVNRALAEVHASAPGRPVALVTHQGVLRVLQPGIRLDNAEHVWLRDGSRDGSGASGRDGEIDSPEVPL